MAKVSALSALPTSTDARDRATLVDLLSASSSAPHVAFDKPPATEYLGRLTSLPLDELLVEPESLATHAHHLTSSLTNLTHSSYSTFLAIHNTTTALTSSLDSLSSSLSALLDSSLPALGSSTLAFKTRTEPILKERSKARAVLEQHDKVRDLLEVPLLIDTCVRNGYFSEALSLAAHVSAALPSSDPADELPIVRDIRLEVEQSVRAMLIMLLNTMREPGRKLPALWKAVTFVRKMEVLREDELALAFLTGRGECLDNALEALGRDSFVNGPNGLDIRAKGKSPNAEREKEDITRYLKKYIDSWREGVHEIITQYSAIFLEGRSSSHPSAPHSTSTLSSSASPDETPIMLRNLLSTYASYALTRHLLPTLTTYLPRVPSAFSSLLTQMTYCATAFARLGMDFRGLLANLFSKAVAEGVKNEMNEAGQGWNDRMQKALRKESKGGKPASVTLPSHWLIMPSLVASPIVPPAASAASSVHIPPSVLSSYPPIAEFTNSLLTVLNGLRLLAPISIFPELKKCLDDVLAEASTRFLQYAEVLENTSFVSDDKEKEMKIMQAAALTYTRVFVPFMRRALAEGIYGQTFNSPDTVNGDKPDEERRDVVAGSDLAKVLGDWDAWIQQYS